MPITCAHVDWNMGDRNGTNTTPSILTTSTTIGFLNLPQELQLMILSFLQPSDLVLGVRRTCHKLYDLSLHPLLWRRFTLYPYDYFEKPQLYWPGIFDQRLSANRRSKAEPNTGDDVSHRPEPSCEGDDSCRGQQGDLAVPTLSLQTLSLQGTVTQLTEDCYGLDNPRSVTQDTVYPNLRSLTLLYCDKPPVGSFLVQHRHLRSLAVEHMKCKTGDDFARLASLIENVTLCEGLSELKMVGRDYEDVSQCSRVWGALQNYVQTGPALTKLHLKIPLDDFTVSTILGQCRSLESLTLGCCPLTSRAFASTLNTPHFSLTALDVSNCIIRDADIIYAMAQSFRCLQELQLQGYATTSTVLRWSHAVNVLPSQEFFPQLTVLRLGLADAEVLDPQKRPEMALAVDPDTVKAPGVWAKRLNTGTTSVTGKLRKLLLETVWDEIDLDRADVVSLQPDLTELFIYRYNSYGEFAVMDTDFLHAVAMRCRRLRKVDLDCRVSLAGLEHLRTLPQLTVLDCHLLEDQEEGESGKGLALRDPDPTKAPRSRLEKLVLEFDQPISEPHLLTLTALCPWLTILHILGPIRGTHHSLRTLLKALQCLRVIEVSQTTSSTVPEDRNILTDEDMDAIVQLGASSLTEFIWIAPVELESLESLARVLVRRPHLMHLRVGAPHKKRKSGGGLWDADSYRSALAKEMREMGPWGWRRPRFVEAYFLEEIGMERAYFSTAYPRDEAAPLSGDRGFFYVVRDSLGVTVCDDDDDDVVVGGGGDDDDNDGDDDSEFDDVDDGDVVMVG